MPINKMEINGIEIVNDGSDDLWFVNKPEDCKRTKLYAGEKLGAMKQKLQAF